MKPLLLKSAMSYDWSTECVVIGQLLLQASYRNVMHLTMIVSFNTLLTLTQPGFVPLFCVCLEWEVKSPEGELLISDVMGEIIFSSLVGYQHARPDWGSYSQDYFDLIQYPLIGSFF